MTHKWPPCLGTRTAAAYGRPMRGLGRVIVVSLIGIATAWLWIRLGLYGFGLPAGVAVVAPSLMLGVLYARARRIGDLGMLLGAFAAVWTAFETWTWLNATTDRAVSIPGWTPIPLAAAIALLVVAAVVTVAASFEAS